MEILAHRGWWTSASEKNTLVALMKACAAGFGIETDVRDSQGKLVLSHDPPLGCEPSLDSFLAEYAARGVGTRLALNIKADGLQSRLQEALVKYGVDRYFAFDMSVPELVRYRACGLRYFARVSDEESEPHGIAGATGLWVDGFASDWTDFDRLHNCLSAGLELAFVSPELHRRPHEPYWEALRRWHRTLARDDAGRVALCTDHPIESQAFFHE